MAQEIPNPILPQVAPQPLPTAYDQNRVTPASQGAAIGEGIQQLAGVGAQILADVKQKANQAAVAQNEAETVSRLNSLLYDPKTGLLNLRGKNALDAMQPTQDAIQKVVDEQQQKAVTPYQERVVKMRTATLVNDANRQIQEHVGRQLNVMADDAFKARIDAGIDSATNAWASPVDRAQAISKLKPFVIADAQRRGLDDVSASQLWANVQKEAAGRIAEQFLDRNLGDAAQSFLAKPLLPGDSQPVLELLGADSGKYVQRARIVADANKGLRTGIALAAKYQVNEYGVVDIGRAMAELNAKVKAGQLTYDAYEKTMAVLNNQNQAGHTQLQTAIGKAYQTLMSVYDRGGATALAADPGAAYAQGILTDPKNIGGANLYDAFLKHQLDQAPTPEQDAAFWRARNAVFADEWNRYAQMGSDQLVASTDDTTGKPWAQELTRRQLEQVAALQTEAKTRLLNKDAHQIPAGVEQELKVAGLRAGLWGSKGPQTEDQQRAAAYIASQIDKNVQAWWRDPKNKAPPLPADYQKWIADELIKGTVPSGGSFGWRGSEFFLPIPIPDFVRESSPVGNVTRAEAETNLRLVGRGFVPKIPRAERSVIEQALQKAGFEVTDDAVLAAYRARHGQK